MDPHDGQTNANSNTQEPQQGLSFGRPTPAGPMVAQGSEPLPMASFPWHLAPRILNLPFPGVPNLLPDINGCMTPYHASYYAPDSWAVQVMPPEDYWKWVREQDEVPSDHEQDLEDDLPDLLPAAAAPEVLNNGTQSSPAPPSLNTAEDDGFVVPPSACATLGVFECSPGQHALDYGRHIMHCRRRGAVPQVLLTFVSTGSEAAHLLPAVQSISTGRRAALSPPMSLPIGPTAACPSPKPVLMEPAAIRSSPPSLPMEPATAQSSPISLPVGSAAIRPSLTPLPKDQGASRELPASRPMGSADSGSTQDFFQIGSAANLIGTSRLDRKRSNRSYIKPWGLQRILTYTLVEQEAAKLQLPMPPITDADVHTYCDVPGAQHHPVQSVFPPVYINIRFLDKIEITAEELMTFFPGHLKWHDAMYRLLQNGWTRPDMTKFINYARGLTEEEGLKRPTTLTWIKDADQEILKDGQHKYKDRPPFKTTGFTTKGWVPHEERYARDVVDYFLVDLADGIVNFPDGNGARLLTRAVRTAIARGDTEVKLSQIHHYIRSNLLIFPPMQSMVAQMKAGTHPDVASLVKARTLW
jgi:hypothetical protein